MIPNGIGRTASALVGNAIGANKIRLAKLNFRLVSVLTLIIAIISVASLYFGRRVIARIFTGQVEIQ